MRESGGGQGEYERGTWKEVKGKGEGEQRDRLKERSENKVEWKRGREVERQKYGRGIPIIP